MPRRLFAGLLALALHSAQAGSLLLQSSPLAGSQYYALDTLMAELKPGERLQLVRDPNNRHDPHAVRVEWRGHMLGYVPRAENRVVAEAMDRGEKLSARVASLSPDPNPWRRLRIEIMIAL